MWNHTKSITFLLATYLLLVFPFSDLILEDKILFTTVSSNSHGWNSSKISLSLWTGIRLPILAWTINTNISRLISSLYMHMPSLAHCSFYQRIAVLILIFKWVLFQWGESKLFWLATNFCPWTKFVLLHRDVDFYSRYEDGVFKLQTFTLETYLHDHI